LWRDSRQRFARSAATVRMTMGLRAIGINLLGMAVNGFAK
jgi:hypothetical protein